MVLDEVTMIKNKAEDLLNDAEEVAKFANGIPELHCITKYFFEYVNK